MKKFLSVLVLLILVYSLVFSQAKLGGKAKLGGTAKINSSAAGGGGGGVDMCFDFRGTSGYVTDTAPCTYVLNTDGYPTTRGGFTFGWVVINNSVFGADRNNGIDARLAGINYVPGGTGPLDTYFRVDLPATGTYTIHLAIGDNTAAQPNQRAEVRDTTTDLSFVVSGSLSGAAHWFDAAGTDRAYASWISSEVGVSETFATTQLRVHLGHATLTDVTCISNLRIIQ